MLLWLLGAAAGCCVGHGNHPLLTGLHCLLSSDPLPAAWCLQEDFKSAVVASSGWSFRPERPDADGFIAQKWAWAADTPGVCLCVCGMGRKKAVQSCTVNTQH